VDLQALEAAYHRLSREVHPDFHHHKPSEERERLLARSALVNRAYRTLRDFHERVAYLVELEGGEALKPKAPPELLADVLDTQELLEERRAAGRVGKDHPLAARVSEEAGRFRQRLDRLEADLRARAAEWDGLGSSNGAAAEDRRRIVGALQDLLAQRVYLINLLRDIESAQAAGG
jgi:molecular chaperone HscB